MQMSGFYLLVAWFVTMTLLYFIIRSAVADGMKDYEKKKNLPDDKERFNI